jgi:hypothetical protein
VYTAIFDSLYWLLGGVMLVAFIATIRRSLRRVQGSTGDRRQALGTLAISIGALLTLIVGFGLNALRGETGDLFYQQVHFGLFYVAFALVLLGFDLAGMLGDRSARRWNGRRAIAWAAFAAATGVALVALLTPESYRIVSGGDVRYVQEPLFFLPLFVALAVGAADLPSWLDGSQRRTARPWLATVAGLLVLGMLRESTIIPATNQPIADLFLALGPFAVAALCLYRAALAPVPERTAPSVAAVRP